MNTFSKAVDRASGPERTATRVTRALLIAGAAAGPFYVVVAVAQGLTRPGFDLTRHDVSLLSNGSLGWIQIANFLVTGLLVIAGAIGLRRALMSGRARTWGPVLVGIYGAGLLGAAVFAADPAAGFPPGTPAGQSTVSWHGMLHLLSAAVGFLSLIAGCFVLARRWAGTRERGWALFSVVTGIVFFAAFAGIAAGSGQRWSVLGFWFGLLVAWVWISTTMIRLLPRAAAVA
ncbi:MAG: DUF998 domain-containing protein [Candidatus Dormiibacterota bacterium]